MALYGRHWQTELADAVGRSARMVAYWLRDPKRYAPMNTLTDLEAVVAMKIDELTDLQHRLQDKAAANNIELE